MNTSEQPLILIAEDDPDDNLLYREAFLEADLGHELQFVEDGVELLDFLYRRKAYRDLPEAPRPRLILLDLKMPRKDGWETLAELKANPQFATIPVVILSTSRNQDDIRRARQMGASAYFSKSVTFTGLVSMLKSLHQYLQPSRPA